MTDEEKLNLIKQRFPEIISRINREKDTNYENITPREKLFFADVFELVFKKDKALFAELWKNMSTCSEQNIARNKEIEKTFNLKQHLINTRQQLCGKDNTFSADTTQEEIQYRPNMENLYNTMRDLSSEKTPEYIRQAQNILTRLTSAKGKTNQALKEALADTDIEFRIISGSQMDGKCQYRKKNPADRKKTLTICLTEGCFNQHQQALGMVISHELGHFIDARGRPDNYQGSLPQSQEFFADTLGYDMARNAGFDIEHYKSETRKMNIPFLNRRMDNLQRLQNNDKSREIMLNNRQRQNT